MHRCCHTGTDAYYIDFTHTHTNTHTRAHTYTRAHTITHTHTQFVIQYLVAEQSIMGWP
jgi:hypothetical protein